MHPISPQKQQSKWPSLIKAYSYSLKLSQIEFGKLFGVSGATVSYWESGKVEAPYSVTWVILKQQRGDVVDDE